MNAQRLFEWTKHPKWTMQELAKHPLDASITGVKLLVCFVLTFFFGITAIIPIACMRLIGQRRLALLCAFCFARQWAKTLLKIAGVPVEIEGTENFDKEKGYVVIANHQSTLDILAVVLAIKQGFRFIAKREILKYPIIGQYMWLADQILIDRENRRQAVTAINKTLERDPKTTLLYFAEGRRTRTGKLQEFKMGGIHAAKQTGLPMLPVALSGGFDLLEKGSLLRFRPKRGIRVRICPPIRAFPDDDPKDLRDWVRAVINANLEPQYRDPNPHSVLSTFRATS